MKVSVTIQLDQVFLDAARKVVEEMNTETPFTPITLDQLIEAWIIAGTVRWAKAQGG